MRAAVIALAVSWMSNCRAPISFLSVPLQYRPTSHVDVVRYSSLIPTQAKLYIADVADVRPDSSSVGANIEGKQPIPIRTNSAPAGFIRDALKRELGNAGFVIVDSPSNATHTLELQLVRLWADESSTYHTEITTRLRLLDHGGAVKWEGVVAGTNTRFGRSLSVENYQDSFSDSVISLVENLMGNPAFMNAFRAN